MKKTNSKFDDNFESSNSRDLNREVESTIEIRDVELSNETFESKFEKSNRARHRKFRREISTTNSARKIKELEFETRIDNRDSRNRIEQRNEKVEFEIRLQNTTSRIREIEFKIRRQNTTRKFRRQIRKRTSHSKHDTKTSESHTTRNANEKASRRTTDERREAHSHETRTRSHETTRERTPETHTSNGRLF